MKITAIVEGDGEVAAFPILLRRLRDWLSPDNYGLEITKPIRVRRDRFLNKEEEFHRMLMLAAQKCEQQGWIVILLDADDDCPAQLSREILDRTQRIVPDRKISIILANKEYEAWFIAARDSLDGLRGFSITHGDNPEPEGIRDAKKWLGSRIKEGKYREITDQPAFSASMDLQQAKDNSRSFLKLCSEWQKNINSTDT
ncbi:DUF4276 family protein [Methylovulum psychrotolerans]|uniref:DUF4276 domain-containing protein n=1 Tax=Methylovulum psychrotolerans TaxID=1704499 RepID=A0A1Z4BXE4_9GAMM|nr:DUF4276 family protein [Methylovulum psychrotolerans]ASF45945.1 hypothetical protein CEK71_07550 [Methylovulum psychrotolerans]